MIKQLREHREALQSVGNRLNGKASLRPMKEGSIICLAMLASTEMQIEDLQGTKKDACQRPR